MPLRLKVSPSITHEKIKASASQIRHQFAKPRSGAIQTVFTVRLFFILLSKNHLF